MDRKDLHKQAQLNKNDPPDISSVLATLDYFHPLSEGIKDYFKKHSYSCSFRKGKLLLKAGEICEHIYFIKKGAVRGFIKDGAKDITTWITAENEVVSSISSLDVMQPAFENMQAIENCELVAMTYADYQTLFIKFPEFNIVARKVLQKYYQDAEGRAFIVRLTSAEKKYQFFLVRYGHLANRIPLKYNIMPDKKKPFIISVNDVQVTVVGTSFNIKSENGNTEVVVETGIVQVTKQGKTVELVAGEKITITPTDSTTTKETVNDKLYNYYRSKEFVCDDTPLWKLLQVLNEAYDANIVIGRKELNDMRLTTTFYNESLEKVLEIIHLTFDITVIKKEDGQIILQ